MQFPILLLVLLLCSFCSLAQCDRDAENWTLSRQGDQVDVYRRMHPERGLQVMAVTRLKTDLSAMILLLRDTVQGPKWIANAKNVTLLARPEPNKDLVRTLFNAPWPVSDRDMITLSEYRQDQRSLILRIDVEDASDQHPLQPGVVRMEEVSGFWQLTPQSDQMVEICYQGSGRAGGKLPGWLSRDLLMDGIFETMQGLREQLPLHRYQNKPLRDIQEPE